MSTNIYTQENQQVSDSLILIVDDVSINLKLLHQALRKTNYHLSFASSGKQALERLQKCKPDLILLDLMMPEMDGIEVCKHIKTNPLTSDIPIIFLTASHESNHLLDAFKHGAVDYINKPFYTPELIARIETHLELYRLRYQAQRQAAQEVVIREIIAAIHSSLNIKNTLNKAVKGIERFLGVDRVLICKRLYSQMEIVAMSSYTARYSHHSFIDTSQKKYLSLNLTENLTSEDSNWLKVCQVTDELRWPITVNKLNWGGLLIQYNQEKVNLINQESLIQPIVAQMETAIQQAELYQTLAFTVNQLERANRQLYKLSIEDQLTKTFNRRYLTIYLEHEWERLKKLQLPLSIIFMDIDYFKSYNSTYGHGQGDYCLQQVAEAFKSVIKRDSDKICRYGGEEFIAILPDTNREGAIYITKQMQEAIANLNIPHITHQTMNRVTVSFGISTETPGDTTSYLDVVNKADRALFQAKANGRNCYYCHPQL